MPLTSTTTVQNELIGRPAPLRLIEFEPAVAVAVPPQPFDKLFGVATTNPAGSVSVKPTTVSGSGFAAGFVIVKVKLVVLFKLIVLRAKCLAIDGGAST